MTRTEWFGDLKQFIIDINRILRTYAVILEITVRFIMNKACSSRCRRVYEDGMKISKHLRYVIKFVHHDFHDKIRKRIFAMLLFTFVVIGL